MSDILRNGILFFCSIAMLSSCGTDEPQGAFTDGSKINEPDSAKNVARFIKNPPPTEWQSDWSTENVVVFQWRGEPDNLHPTNGASNPRMMIFDYTQRFLMRLDYETLMLSPDLAASMPEESPDGKAYSYTLREGVTWDDGSPLTSDDVIFTIMSNACPYTDNPQYKPAFEFFQSIEKDTINPLKFKIVMTQKYIGNLSLFTAFPILQESFYDKNKVLRKYTAADFLNPDFTKQAHSDVEAWAKEFNEPKYGTDIKLLNGLGPYELTAWENKYRMELTRKKSHWTHNIKDASMYDASLPEKIIFRYITDENAIALEFKNQTVDASCWISTHGLMELRKDSIFNRNYHSAFVSNYDWQYIGFNMKPEAVNRKKFFTDKKVRRAIALLIPADEMNNAYYEGQATRMTSMVPQTRPDAYNNDLKVLGYDIEGAKKLLDEAGWKDTDGDNVRDKIIDGKKVQFEFEFLVMSGNPVMPSMVADIKNSMKQAGIVVNIQELEFGTFYERLAQHEFDLYFGAWSGSSQPEDYKQLWHSSSWENGGSNYVGYSNAKADALIEKIRVETTDSLRIPMEKELQAILYDDQPYVFMYLVPRKVAIHKRFDHAYMFWEKPGVYLSWLKLMTPATMRSTAN